MARAKWNLSLSEQKQKFWSLWQSYSEPAADKADLYLTAEGVSPGNQSCE